MPSYLNASGKAGYWNAEGDDSKVYACFLNIREPMQVQARQAENMERWRFEDKEGVMVYTDKFYDLAWNDVINLSEIVVHDSTQIKSATDNRGTFDGGNADITYSIAMEIQDNLLKLEFSGKDTSINSTKAPAVFAAVEDKLGGNKKAVAGDGLTPQQPQATSASRFHRTATVTPLERYIKQNDADERKISSKELAKSVGCVMMGKDE